VWTTPFRQKWLRSERPPTVKVVGLAAAAVCCLATAYVWSLNFPINKILWTSSFVLWAGGWSLALLAAFYFAIDVKGFQRWAFVFTVIGMNPITMYLMQDIVDFRVIANYFAGGRAKCSGDAAPLVLTLTAVTAKWLMLWFLYRKNTFLRV